ncbi:uncharacterized protein LOC134704874 [Mytilus trossulus]|uniref:uncharacterized protein LOC134704874 n=1 Tax=Mytilus trossulus TaxID=6551 RepID=UPI0030070B20
MSSKKNVQFKGSCDHEMINKIYSSCLDELMEHEKVGMKKLRVEIHRIVNQKTDFKVTIYLNKLGPVTIQDGRRVLQELVVQFKENGDIDYVWGEQKYVREYDFFD